MALATRSPCRARAAGRWIGFDNAHGAPAKGPRLKRGPKAIDHWHRTQTDEGRAYAFKDAETLICDFFDEVERALKEHGVAFEAVGEDEGSPQ